MGILYVLAGLLVVLASGCGGIQGGNFVTTGEKSWALSSGAGLIDIVEGRDERYRAASNQIQGLLYLLILSPDVPAKGPESQSDYGRYVSTFTFSWAAGVDSISTNVSWDRRKDTVSIAGQDFPRGKGNVFLIRRGGNGKFIGRQLRGLGPDADFLTVLRHVKNELPNDGALAGLALENANSH